MHLMYYLFKVIYISKYSEKPKEMMITLNEII